MEFGCRVKVHKHDFVISVSVDDGVVDYDVNLFAEDLFAELAAGRCTSRRRGCHCSWKNSRRLEGGPNWRRVRVALLRWMLYALPDRTDNSYSCNNTQLLFAAEVRSRGVIGKSSLCSEPTSSCRCGTQLDRERRGGVVRVRVESEEVVDRGDLGSVC
jgi:hypothetical protein